MSKLAIIAGNFEEYRDYLRENRISPHEAVYVRDIEQLCGWYPDVKYVGNYWRNPVMDFRDELKRLELIRQARQGGGKKC